MFIMQVIYDFLGKYLQDHNIYTRQQTYGFNIAKELNKNKVNKKIKTVNLI